MIDIAAVHGRGARVAVGDVADDGLTSVGGWYARRHEIEDRRLVPVVAQLIDDVRADEAARRP